MLKLAVLVIAALAAPCLAQTFSGRCQPQPFIHGGPDTSVWIEGDPQIVSLSKGLETCSYSSPSWINSFYSEEIFIDTVFTEMNYGDAHPTILSAVKVTFNRPCVGTEIYVAANHNRALWPTFVSGVSSVAGWLSINWLSPQSVIISDFSTASTITIQLNRAGNQFSVTLFSSAAFIKNGGGLLVDGCPYSSVFPWQSSYNGNPFITGRRKRQAEDACNEVANIYVESLKDFEGYNYDNVYNSCISDSKFIPETPELRKEALETLKVAAESHKANFPEWYEPKNE